MDIKKKSPNIYTAVRTKKPRNISIKFYVQCIDLKYSIQNGQFYKV